LPNLDGLASAGVVGSRSRSRTLPIWLGSGSGSRGIRILPSLALTGAIPNESSQWNPHRFTFQTQFAIDKYEVRTDGFLQVQGATGKVQAIVEVKRGLREDHKPMQEAAEMVGWIMDNDHQPDPSVSLRYITLFDYYQITNDYSHVLVSQTYTEVWLSRDSANS
jgi:hypothetical protein